VTIVNRHLVRGGVGVGGESGGGVDVLSTVDGGGTLITPVPTCIIQLFLFFNTKLLTIFENGTE